MEGSVNPQKEYTIKEAADILHVTTKTIRNRIEDGRITAHPIKGKYGDEWRITDLGKDEPLEVENAPQENLEKTALESTENAPATTKLYLEFIAKLTAENQRLAMENGRLQEQVKLLAAPRKKWWKFWK